MLDWLYQNKLEVLKKSQSDFLNSSSLIPKIGCELEFFLLKKTLEPLSDQSIIDNVIAELKLKLTKEFFLIYDVEKEAGESQIEIKTSFTADLEELCNQLGDAKEFIINYAIKNGFSASFAAQPFLDDCGNALQFNISLHEESGKNLFEKKDHLFLKTILNLLNHTNGMLILLAPNPEDYQRFDLDLNKKLHKIGKYPAPTNLSFGENNRTTAIRIPQTANLQNTRIEYRVACANANPYLAVAAILSAINSKEEIDEISPIYGNAFDENYHLIPLIKDYKTALKNYKI